MRRACFELEGALAETLIADLTTISDSFPELPSNYIERDNLIDALDDVLKGSRCVCLLGQEGIGKSQLLAAFARRHSSRAINAFVRRSDRWSFDVPQLGRNLWTQALWILDGKLPSETPEFDVALYMAAMNRLSRRAIRDGSPYYIVIDGLFELGLDQKSAVEQVVDQLVPVHLSRQLRLAVSGEYEKFAISDSLSPRAYQVARFSTDQARVFLSSNGGVSTVDADALAKLARNVPGDLATIQRLLAAGNTPADILAGQVGPSGQDKYLLDREWARAKTLESSAELAVAILASDQQPRSVWELAELVGSDAAELQRQLDGLSFLVEDAKTNRLEFVSELSRLFALAKLKHRQNDAVDAVIRGLTSKPESADALVALPLLYEKRGRLQDLVTFLSPQHFVNLIGATQSLVEAARSADLGVSIAQKLERDGELFRFGIQRSMIASHTSELARDSEVNARLAVKQVDEALALAISTPLKEQRLILLAKVARGIVAQGDKPDAALIDQIRSLAESVPSEAYGDRVLSLATDLVVVAPDLAISLIENAPADGVGERADFAFMAMAGASLGAGAPEKAREITNRIRDPKKRAMFASLTPLFDRRPPAKILAYAQEIEGPRDRLLMMRLWIRENREHPDAWRIVDAALSLAIESSEITIDATTLRELARALPFVQPKERAWDLCRRFDSQKAGCESVGPAEEYVGLLLLLAAGERSRPGPASSDRLIEAYAYLDGVADPSIRATCVAQLYSALKRYPEFSAWEADQALDVQEEFRNAAGDALTQIGVQDHFADSIVRVIGRSLPERTLEFIGGLNTRDTRNLALKHFVEVHSGLLPSDWNAAALNTAIGSIDDESLRQQAIEFVVQQLVRRRDSAATQEVAKRFIERAKRVTALPARCRIWAGLHAVFAEEGREDEGILGLASHHIDEATQQIESAWKQVQTSFEVARALAENSLDLAKSFVDRAFERRSEAQLGSSESAETYFLILMLQVRALGGLLRHGVVDEGDIRRTVSQIESAGSASNRAVLLGELAIYLFVSGNTQEAQAIVSSKIQPLIESLPTGDDEYRAECTTCAASALYLAHKDTALERIASLPVDWKNDAVARITTTIVTGKPGREPWDSDSVFELPYERLRDLVQLCDYCSDDSQCWSLVSLVCKELQAKVNRRRYTENQRVELRNRLEVIVQTYFPRPGYISHAGYQIVARCDLYRTNPKTSAEQWQAVASEARAIPNVPDRAFVLSILAVSLPKTSPLQAEVVKESIDTCEAIRSIEERLACARRIGETLLAVDSGSVRQLIQRCGDLTKNLGADDAIDAQRDLVELAHKIDPAFAQSLASVIDKDEARAAARQRLAVLDTAKDLSDPTKASLASESLDPAVFGNACWRQLRLLNSLRAPALRPRDLRKSAVLAARLRLEESYPAWAWIIENNAMRVGAQDARAQLYPLFVSLVNASDLSLLIAKRATRLGTGTIERASMAAPNEGTLIRAGERQKALDWLRRWLEAQVGANVVTVVDQYFGTEDLHFLQLVGAALPGAEVRVLTSRRHQESERIPQPFDESYRNYWRLSVSESDPPPSEIVIVSNPELGSPIHDRLILCGEGGLKLGTSLNSMGRGASSDIIELSRSVAGDWQGEADQFLLKRRREYNGGRLNYISFTL